MDIPFDQDNIDRVHRIGELERNTPKKKLRKRFNH